MPATATSRRETYDTSVKSGRTMDQIVTGDVGRLELQQGSKKNSGA